MPESVQPGKIFENLFRIKKEFKTSRALLNNRAPLSLDFFDLDFEWIEKACLTVRKDVRSRSFSEFQEIGYEADYYVLIHRILLEVISDGKHCVLLVNTCPLAQVDIKGEMGLVEYFDFPPMSEQDWNYWELMGASTIHFEMEDKQGDIILTQVKTEEGIVNALRMRRSVNLWTGDVNMSVSTLKCTLPADPSLENLMSWIDVRSGISDAGILDGYEKENRQDKGV